MKRKNYLIGIIVILLYFIYNSFQLFPLEILGIDYSKLNLNVKIIYSLSYELLFIFILFLIYKNLFISKFKDYIKNFKIYIKKYIDYWALAFGLMTISNLIIITLFPNSTATNQESVNEIFKIAPYYILISGVLFAPLVEETVFRLSIRNIFKNDKLFILISGLVFGTLHVVGSFENIVDLIYIIPYSIPGFIFAYTLVKSDNIFVPMSLHFFHNAFTMALQFILTLL